MDAENKSDVVIYNDGELELNVSVDNETVWLNRHQLAELFGRDIKTIGKHINNVFKEEELDEKATVANIATVQNEASRDVKRDIQYYNLDMIISIGYRVKSQKGVRFRQWATSVLRSYITNGYVINSEKITHQRFKELEENVALLKSQVTKLSHLQQIKTLSEGIYFDGQIFDAHNFISELIRSAKSTILLIDN